MLKTSRQPRRAFALGALLLGAGFAHADSQVLPDLLEACKGEISEYCGRITPGSGRIVACLYAHEDGLSRRCDYLLLDAAAELQNTMAALQRVADVCKPDIDLLCGKVESGEGRVARCLKAKQQALSAPCHDAFEKIGIDVK